MLPRQRLAASLAIASALHLALIVGIDLPPKPAPVPSPVVELTLTGHGPPASAARAVEPLREAKPRAEEPPTVEAAAPAPQAVVASDMPEDRSGALDASPKAAPNPLAGRNAADLARAVVASIGVPRTAERRVRRLGDGAPMNAELSYYVESWRRKVERIGKLNYPREALVKGLVGRLRLRVAIAPDGTLKEVRILETSGHRVFDDAAERIVRLAAPYSPFPPRLRETTDLLEIERTWQFRKSRLPS